jgi:hypothetical protein
VEVEQAKEQIISQLIGCSCLAEIRNDSDVTFKLRRRETRIVTGAWIAEPPRIIPAHATVLIACCSSVMLSGTSAKVVYAARRDRVGGQASSDESGDDGAEDTNDTTATTHAGGSTLLESDSRNSSSGSSVETATWEDERCACIIKFSLITAIQDHFGMHLGQTILWQVVLHSFRNAWHHRFDEVGVTACAGCDSRAVACKGCKIIIASLPTSSTMHKHPLRLSVCPQRRHCRRRSRRHR